MEKIAESPGCLTSLSDTTYGGAGLVGLLWATLDSPGILQEEGRNEPSATVRIGAQPPGIAPGTPL